MLIFYDLDIITIILWIVYGSVIVIFFIYSLSWFENIKEFYFFFRARFVNYFIVSISFIIFFYLLNLDFSTDFLDVEIGDFNLINFYELLCVDVVEELEMLGWGLVYYTSFLFLIVAYFFFLVCCSIVLIITTARKIKNNTIMAFLTHLRKSTSLQYFNVIKNQHFFVQEYEFVYQNFTFTKNFKVTGVFHKIGGRRI